MGAAIVRRIAVATVAAAALLGTSSLAMASVGCTALNGSYVGGVSSGSMTGTDFEAGDTITLTITAAAGLDELGLYSLGGHSTLVARSSTAGTRTYVVPANTPHEYVIIGSQANAGSSFAWSCAAGGASGGGTGSVQEDGTSVVGKVSGSAIVDAVGDVVEKELGGSDKDPEPPAPHILTREEYIAAAVKLWGEGSAGGAADQYDQNLAWMGIGPVALTRNSVVTGFVWTKVPTAPSAVSSYVAQTKSDAERYVDEVFAALGPNSLKVSATLAPQWSTWLDIRLSGFEHGTPNTLSGLQVNALAGISYKAMPGMVIGAFAGYEAFNYDFAALTGNLKGGGATLGTYAGINITPTLRLKGSLAWTGLGYDTKDGAATGSFTGSRLLASTALTGKVELGDYVVAPSASVLALWEHQTGYTDSAAIVHAARSFSNGRVAVGGTVTAVEWSDVFTPYLGIYGDWRFASGNALAAAGISDGWSARVIGGIDMPISTNGSLSLGGEYGGIGANYKVWSGNARLKVQF